MSALIDRPVLVLNATYEPINICGVRRAVNLLMKGAARIQEGLDDVVLHPDLQMPSIIRLNHYARIPHKNQTLSRKNILVRDEYTCQYCGKEFPARELTLDHIQPRSKGGLSTWENMVACCQPCNAKKADKDLADSGLTLLKRPKAMTIHTSRGLMRQVGGHHPSWRKYLYY